MAESIDIQTLKALLRGPDKPVLLDVRRKSDHALSPSVIPGAEWRDPEQVEVWVDHLPAGRRTVVYCVKGGSVSQSIADRLHQEGLSTAFLDGGIKAWVENGEPVERGPS